MTAQILPPPGSYLGYLQLSGQDQVIRLEHRNDSLLIRLPDLAPGEEFLADATGNELTFAWRHENWCLKIHQQENSRYQGQVQRTNDAGVLLLYRLATEQAVTTEAYANNFALPGGEVISIWSQRGFLQLHAPVSGQNSHLYKINDHQFISSAGELLSFVAMEEDHYQNLEYQYLTGNILSAILVPAHHVIREEIMLLGDTVGLSLFMPPGDGPFPACVIPMGAANYERWIYTLEARLLADHGIAALIYDNYGTGKSGGTLYDKTFINKRDQAIALHDWLAGQPKIQPNGIGFRGGSQGGRLSLMAAAKVTNTAFVVALSAPLETRLDQQLYALAANHRQRGFPEEAIAQSSDVWRRYFQAVVDQKADATIDEEIVALRQSHPEMFLPRPTGGNTPTSPRAGDLTEDVRSYLSEIDCPVLALYGTDDKLVPPHRSARLLRQGLLDAGKSAPEIILYPGASHSFQLPGQRIVPGLFMDQIRFIKGIMH